MKDLINIQDFLFTDSDVGDWEGDEELIADKLNDLLHFCFDRIPEQMDTQTIEQTLNGIWESLRGDMALLDTDLDELRDWVIHYMYAVENS